VLSTSHHLTAAGHVGRTHRTCFAGLLAQGARHAEQVRAAVSDRRAVDVLQLADVGADAALTADADPRTEDEQQRVTAARASGRLGHLAGRVARTEKRHDAHGAVAETAAQVVLERRHRISLPTPDNYMHIRSV